MAIDDVYRRYFQKSKIFLYPLLGIKRGSSVTPIQTYLSWNSYYDAKDMKLIAKYHVRNDFDYNKFHKNVLLKHSRLCDYVLLDTEYAVFTFDLSDMGEDWEWFLQGKYSKMSKARKKRILDYYDPNTGNYVYVESYLFPEKYFEEYADILKMPVHQLEAVGELCPLPDFDKEALKVDVEDLEKQKILDYFVQN